MLFTKRFVASILAALMLTGSFLMIPGKNVLAAESPSVEISMKANNYHDYNAFITDMYSSLLGRYCTSAEIDYWYQLLSNNKITGSAVAYLMATSDECTNGCTNEEFVQRLYRGFMRREATEREINYWCAHFLAGATRSDITVSILNSSEFRNVCDDFGIFPGTRTNGRDPIQESNINFFVYRMYAIGLSRTPDQDGLKYWTNQLANHICSGIGFAYTMFFSDEYVAMNVSTHEFVNNMYLAFFDRIPSSAEVSYWSNILDGMSDDGIIHTDLDVFNGFAESNEFDRICVEYNIMRGWAVGGVERVYARPHIPLFQNGNSVVAYAEDTGIQVTSYTFRDLVDEITWVNGTMNQGGAPFAIYENSSDLDLRLHLIRRQSAPVTIYAAAYQNLGEREVYGSTQQLWSAPIALQVNYNWETGEYDIVLPAGLDLPSGQYTLVFSTEDISADYRTIESNHAFLGLGSFNIA